VVTDEFEDLPFVLGRVTSVCVAAGIDGSPAQRTDRYLVCHKAKAASGPPFAARDVANEDAFLSHPLRLTKTDVVCIPSREI
jgi:hypothetical protein